MVRKLYHSAQHFVNLEFMMCAPFDLHQGDLVFQEVGEGIRASGVAREEIFVTSKLWNNKHHPEDVEAACRGTLADLGLEYLDLYLIHWPHAFQRGEVTFPKNEDGSVKFDETIHPTDTWLAMEKLVPLGLVRSIGISNFNSEQIADVLKRGSIKPVTNQVECQPYLNQAKLLGRRNGNLKYHLHVVYRVLQRSRNHTDSLLAPGQSRQTLGQGGGHQLDGGPQAQGDRRQAR